MKTIEELKEWACKEGPKLEEFIAAIQLDAKRAAYAECAEIAERRRKFNETIGSIYLASESLDFRNEIRTALDNLKLP